MTTIAYRDGLMACDTGSLFGGMKYRTENKITRRKNALIGITGNHIDGIVFADWWEAGADRSNLPVFREYAADKETPDFEVLVAESEKVTWWAQHFQPDPITVPFWAIGSGAKAAMAAMHMGADPAEAIRVTILVDYYTNGDVQVERVGELVPLHFRSGKPGGSPPGRKKTAPAR